MKQAAIHENFSRPQEGGGASNRSFGIVFTVVFAVIALLPLRRGGDIRWWSLGISAAFLLLALLLPGVLQPLNRAWFKFGLLIAKITNPIILGAMFYLVFTPIAFVCRLLGKDFLRLAPEPGAGSYWIPREPPGPAPESMRNQF